MDRQHYDIVVIGGAFAGSSFSLLLRRWRPGTTVLIVEPRRRFDRKVGEATVEVSAHFLEKTLELGTLLERDHLPKHGLRFWFADRNDRTLEQMTEIGPHEAPALPSFQLDREKLDPALLALAEREGAEVALGCRVTGVDTGGEPRRVEIRGADGRRHSVTADWLIDASGRHGVLSRKWGLRKDVSQPATSAVWARWNGVANLDACDSLPTVGARRQLATNHFCGYGWWCWLIPMANGRSSVGLVYDRELFELAGRGPLLDRYVAFVQSRPGLRELLADATVDAHDHMAYRHLPYRVERYAGPGWALLGDAATFLDPFYSPGLDHTAMSVFATARLVERALESGGEALEAELEEHNARFLRSYDRWLRALYVDKYELMGDAELTAASYLTDTALYYMGVVSPILRDPEALGHPTFGLGIPATRIAAALMTRLRRRLVRLARYRRTVGSYGARNHGWRSYASAFRPGAGSLPHLARGLAIWLRLEGQCAFGRLRGRRADTSGPVPAPLPR